MAMVLECKHLQKNYKSVRALDDFNISLPSGRIIGLLGPNGSGKTTLIKLIAGLLTPTEGEVTVCGKPIGPETKALVSYLPDRVYFDPNQKISELLDFFQDLYEDFDMERALRMLERMSITPSIRFKNLSKGGREKVQLTLVMSRRARLYLLDEPIAGVDPVARDFILQTIITNYDPTATVLISTHLISDVEQILDEYIFIHQGKLLRYGSADQVRDESGRSLDEEFREVFKCLANY